MARISTQKAILKSDTERTAPDNIEKPDVKKIISKSRKKTSLNEFALVNNLRPEIKAGFKAWLKGEYYHFDNEWKELFEKYTNR